MYTRAPAMYPIKANPLIFFKYHTKSIFSIPIAATPAAEPMINMDPPVPAQYARNSQIKLSAGYFSRLYIPIEAATKGTLSTTALTSPINKTIKSSRPTVSSSHAAREDKTCVCSRIETARSIPIKKTIYDISILDKAVDRSI